MGGFHMNPERIGALIRSLRVAQGMTQLALAEQLGVSDKAVSKWETGSGAPDVAIFPRLAAVLNTEVSALLRGDLGENDKSNGNLKKLRFFLCPECGNLLFSTESKTLSCCGKTLEPLVPQPADAAHTLSVASSDGDWYVTAEHEMTRAHFISFVALLTEDTLFLKKCYPEWGLEARIPRGAHGTLLWYCTRHGLFATPL